MYDLTFYQAMQALQGGVRIDLPQHTQPDGTVPWIGYDPTSPESSHGPLMVKLPEWGGFWFLDPATGKVMVETFDGKLLDTPWYDKYKDRNDWQTTDGLVPRSWK